MEKRKTLMRYSLAKLFNLKSRMILSYLSLGLGLLRFLPALFDHNSTKGQGGPGTPDKHSYREGVIDPDFRSGSGANDTILCLALQSDGKILVGGAFINYDSVSSRHIARLNLNGSLDPSFNPGSGADGNVVTLAVQRDDKILIGGEFNNYNGVARRGLARLNPDGSLDRSFTSSQDALGVVSSILVLEDAKILVGGLFSKYLGIVCNSLARLNPDGSLDRSFKSATGDNSTVRQLALQPDGKLLVGGYLRAYNGDYKSGTGLIRLHPNGSLDTSFNQSGSGADGGISTLRLLPDGRILIAGWFNNYNGIARCGIAQLHMDGSLDFLFNPGSGLDGLVQAILLLNDGSGSVFISGFFDTYNNVKVNRLAWLCADGSLQPEFDPGSGTNNYVLAMLRESEGISISNGKVETLVLIVGGFTSYNGRICNRIMRLRLGAPPTVTLDSLFNPYCYVGAELPTVRKLATSYDGKIVITGTFNTYNTIDCPYFAQLNKNGTLDTTFNPGGIPNDLIWAVTVQKDGKVVIAGAFTSYNSIPVPSLARLNTDGSFDHQFSFSGNINETANHRRVITLLTIQNDDKILIGSCYTDSNGFAHNSLVRLNQDGSVDTSFTAKLPAAAAVASIGIQSDGKLVVGGDFNGYGRIVPQHIARLNPDGTLDATFNPGTGFDKPVTVLAVQPDGKILAGGNFNSYAGISYPVLARLNLDGSLDTSFVPVFAPNSYITALALQPDGKIIVAGWLQIIDAYEADNFISKSGDRIGKLLIRLQQNGLLDNSFNSNISLNGRINAVALEDDGNLLIGGDFSTADNYTRQGIARLTLNHF